MKTYPEESFARLAKLEAGHFWFEERNNLIIWVLKKWGVNSGAFLEVGCGTGFVLQRVGNEFPEVDITGVEYFEAALPIAKSRSPNAKIAQADITALNFTEKFDMLGCFDVLEHIPDDQLAIANLYDCLKPGGTLVATVPQHPALWNLHDEQACHARRYKRHELQDKLTTAGFNVCYSTSFMTALLPLMVLRKMRKGHKEASAQDAGEFRPHPAVNRTLRLILGVEQVFIRFGFRLPIGGSRLVVAKKK